MSAEPITNFLEENRYQEDTVNEEFLGCGAVALLILLA
jgi:hypothetical protein